MKRSLSWIAALTVLILLSFSFSGCGNEERLPIQAKFQGEINGGAPPLFKIIDAEGAEFGASGGKIYLQRHWFFGWH